MGAGECLKDGWGPQDLEGNTRLYHHQHKSFTVSHKIQMRIIFLYGKYPIAGCYSFWVCGFKTLIGFRNLVSYSRHVQWELRVTLKCRANLSKKVLTWNHDLVTLKNFCRVFQKCDFCIINDIWLETVQMLSRKRITESLCSFIELTFFCNFQTTYCFYHLCLFFEISCSKQKPAFHIIFLLMPSKTQHWSSLKKYKTLSTWAICPPVTFQCRIKSHCLLIVLCWKLKVLVSSTKHFGAFKRKVKSFLTSRGSTLKYITFHLKGKRAKETLLNTVYGLYNIKHTFVAISLSCFWFEKGTSQGQTVFCVWAMIDRTCIFWLFDQCRLDHLKPSSLKFKCFGICLSVVKIRLMDGLFQMYFWKDSPHTMEINL